MEANSSLMKRFDESRVELEKVLRLAQNCLMERGNPEELLKKHTVRKHIIIIIIVMLATSGANAMVYCCRSVNRVRKIHVVKIKRKEI